MNKPTADIKEFLGLRNKHNVRRLPLGALVKTQNVDLDDAKGLVLRQGYAKVATMGNITASFSTQDERRAFVVDGGDLFVLGAGLTPVKIHSGIGEGYIHWLEIADYVLLSTGHVIDKDNRISSWAIPRPVSPQVSEIAGKLSKGVYRVVTTYIDKTGREGGASNTVQITLGADTGIRVVPALRNGYNSRIYVTCGDGTVYYRVAQTNDEFDVIELARRTSPLDAVQLRADRVPEGVGPLAFYDSRVWASQTAEGGSVIWYSQPFWWNLFEVFGTYIAIPGRVNSMIGTAQGLLIATDDEIYVYTVEESLTKLADYGVPEGVPLTVRDDSKVYLWTHQGMCEFAPFRNMTEEKASVPPGKTAHLELVEKGGYRRLIALTNGESRNDNIL